LQEEFLAPSIETVEAALIELNGRPIESITGNAINSGRTVALAHILGLNRDPSTWKKNVGASDFGGVCLFTISGMSHVRDIDLY
jgi:hypothetical protein